MHDASLERARARNSHVDESPASRPRLRVRVFDKRAFIAPDRLGDVDVDLRPYLASSLPDEPRGAPWKDHACLAPSDATCFALDSPLAANKFLWLAAEKVQRPTVSLAIKIFQAARGRT